MNDAQYPWVILVPDRDDIGEIHQLAQADRILLNEESNRLAAHMAERFEADKMNIAALGNVVPQLHVHHVARFKSDTAWPAPIWGVSPPVAYGEGDLEVVIQRLALEKLQGFTTN